MNILIISTTEYIGGAAIAANRLMKGLKKYDVKTNMLVAEKQTEDINVSVCGFHYIYIIKFLWERLVIWINKKFNKENLFKIDIANTGFDITTHPLFKEADIINLHWVNQGMLSIKGLEKIFISGKVIVWTMHDMWSITGICHYSYECNNFTRYCGKCPLLRSDNEKDLSFRIWKKKSSVIAPHIYFVTVSQWLENLTKISSLTKANPVTVIPNVIDTSIFKPGNKEQIRNKLGIPKEKKLITMGAVRLDNDIKGCKYLFEALEYLKKNEKYRDEILIVFFGALKDPGFLNNNLSFPYVYMGTVIEPERVAELYVASDVTVVPSLYETFGQTITESMACSCPVVSFDNSGQTDIIDHKENGYLAKYKDSEDFANGIKWIFDNSVTESLQIKCIQKIKENYTEEIVTKKYISLFDKLLKAKIKS